MTHSFNKRLAMFYVSLVIQKGAGYHLDLCVCAITVFLTSLFGLPWFVAATVQSVTHVRSLFRESETKAPGEKPVMIGVRYWRSALWFHESMNIQISAQYSKLA